MKCRYLSGRFLAVTLVLGAACATGTKIEAAQTGGIDGSVTDSVTGDPVPDAQISIESSGVGTTANAFGRFELSDIATGQAIVPYRSARAICRFEFPEFR